MNSFSLACTPQLYFGPGKFSAVATVAKDFGSRIILITGARSFTSSIYHQNLLQGFRDKSIDVEDYTIDTEPTPQLVDAAVQKFTLWNASAVIAIGGGSVLDAGKAIAAMLPLQETVKNYLEGVGTKSVHPGVKVPFIAVPTTSGTGSEATKNAVLSEIGKSGYKKSLRHNNFVPNVAIVDPELTLSCPPEITAASGMDAFTQLLESYVSTAANPITDSLAVAGLKYISTSLRKAYRDGGNIAARTDMALASYLSGITLANAGLGVVHGFASAIGGYHPISHGIICSTLMTPSNKITVRKLRLTNEGRPALVRYAAIGKIFADHEHKQDDFYIEFLLDLIGSWTTEMNIPTLSQCGLISSDFDEIVKATENKNNPCLLNRDEMMEVLEMAMG
jgi:alcohol dehydrogenase class IV